MAHISLKIKHITTIFLSLNQNDFYLNVAICARTEVINIQLLGNKINNQSQLLTTRAIRKQILIDKMRSGQTRQVGNRCFKCVQTKQTTREESATKKSVRVVVSERLVTREQHAGVVLVSGGVGHLSRGLRQQPEHIHQKQLHL